MIVSAGFRVVVVTGVVVVGEELAEFDEQPVSTTGSTAIATVVIDALNDLKTIQIPV
ncbi:MAG: hypothetical protein M0008_10230 [Actinomycetota bacterium]|nr:hypothetical protein [Actinomycetota bacterium]